MKKVFSLFSMSLFIALQYACWLKMNFHSRGHNVFVYFDFLTVCWSLLACVCLWFTLWSMCSLCSLCTPVEESYCMRVFFFFFFFFVCVIQVLITMHMFLLVPQNY